jgi:hypothetical protein
MNPTAMDEGDSGFLRFNVAESAMTRGLPPSIVAVPALFGLRFPTSPSERNSIPIAAQSSQMPHNHMRNTLRSKAYALSSSVSQIPIDAPAAFQCISEWSESKYHKQHSLYTRAKFQAV